MADNEIIYLSATELGRRIRRREITSVEATEAYLRQIERVEPTLNAYITVLADQAIESARQADSEIAAGTERGPLHGVPVGVKDQIHTAGILTTSASKLRADFVPDEDATVVRNLKSAGAVIIGKTNMTELAFGDPITSAFGVTGNPWDPPRNPGTSSTGSGAATAAFMCATSLGEDTGGSVRGPAANCGIVGSASVVGQGQQVWRGWRVVVARHHWAYIPNRRRLRRHHRRDRRPRPARSVHLGHSRPGLSGGSHRKHIGRQNRRGARVHRPGRLPGDRRDAWRHIGRDRSLGRVGCRSQRGVAAARALGGRRQPDHQRRRTRQSKPRLDTRTRGRLPPQHPRPN